MVETSIAFSPPPCPSPAAMMLVVSGLRKYHAHAPSSTACITTESIASPGNQDFPVSVANLLLRRRLGHEAHLSLRAFGLVQHVGDHAVRRVAVAAQVYATFFRLPQPLVEQLREVLDFDRLPLVLAAQIDRAFLVHRDDQGLRRGFVVLRLARLG